MQLIIFCLCNIPKKIAVKLYIQTTNYYAFRFIPYNRYGNFQLT